MSIRYLDYSSSICASYTGWSSIFVGEVYEGPYCRLGYVGCTGSDSYYLNSCYIRTGFLNDEIILKIKRK